MLDHIILLDPKKMKCLNMELFRLAADLGDVINDRSNAAAMKDSYPIAIFSWQTLTRLLSKGRFDGAFYILPFLFIFLAERCKTLSKSDRMKLLEIAVNIFYYHLMNVRESKSDDIFTPTFKSSSIGTLFGDKVFIYRCINIALSFAIALEKFEDFSFARIGTHDIETFYGLVRIISFFN